ncbi:hypothetical protein CA85_41320 [Allorhodopirellula solitaria]|uniref:Uncharacterized protein n=1 Tax=Allorhodopirellula solitaria TaxID=2527987 RepID=A0A5C5X160_9BACT|nr:hypothetical protein CA85_41320 [Allorhodopirellula solitaria]
MGTMRWQVNFSTTMVRRATVVRHPMIGNRGNPFILEEIPRINSKLTLELRLPLIVVPDADSRKTSFCVETARMLPNFMKV